MGNIEKDWMLNENKVTTPRQVYVSYETSTVYSPINSIPVSRNISPIGLRSNTKSPLSCLSSGNKSFEDSLEKEMHVKRLKDKEDAFEIMISLKENQEIQLKNAVSAYRRKLEELEEERNDILRMKAKVFSEVRKLKEIENSLEIREKLLKSEPVKNTRPIENEVKYFLDCEKSKIFNANKKINEEYNKIHQEKIEISKIKTLLDYKHKAAMSIWPIVNDLLNSYRLIKI